MFSFDKRESIPGAKTLKSNAVTREGQEGVAANTNTAASASGEGFGSVSSRIHPTS
jgi:hypothetical protein